MKTDLIPSAILQINKVTQTRSWLFIMVWLFVIAGCGATEGENKPLDENWNQSSTLLEGIWTSNCESNSALGTSQLSVISYSGNLGLTTINNFTGRVCENMTQRKYYTYYFEIGGKVSLMDNTIVREIDFTYNKVSASPFTKDVALLWNESEFCGYSNWVAGTEHEITDASCDTEKIPAKNQKLYDIFLIQNTTLTFGNKITGDGSSADARPIVLSTSGFENPNRRATDPTMDATADTTADA